MLTMPTMDAAEMHTLLSEHWSTHYPSDDVASAAAKFQEEHVVILPDFLPGEVAEALKNEASSLVDDHGAVRNLNLSITDGTPRSLTTVGQPTIKQNGRLIHSFYFSDRLLDIASAIVGEKVHHCPYAGEHYVVSRLTDTGDTHGWHWDDFTYGIILVLEAPNYRDGGFIQAVPHTAWDKTSPDVYGALLKSRVQSYAPTSGDAYIIKTNTTMHRVHPIRNGARRTIVNMTLASTSDLTRPMTHETNDILFGGGSSMPGKEN